MHSRRSLVFAALVLVLNGAAAARAETNATRAVAGSATATAALPAAPATTVSPVRIEVTRMLSWQTEHETSRAVSRNAHSQVRTLSTPKLNGVQLEIKVSNLSPNVYPKLLLRWTALLRGSELKEGQISGSLGLGQTLARKTEKLPIAREADLSGCLIEVVSDGRMIGSAEDPPGIGGRIEKLRAARARSKPK